MHLTFPWIILHSHKFCQWAERLEKPEENLISENWSKKRQFTVLVFSMSFVTRSSEKQARIFLSLPYSTILPIKTHFVVLHILYQAGFGFSSSAPKFCGNDSTFTTEFLSLLLSSLYFLFAFEITQGLPVQPCCFLLYLSNCFHVVDLSCALRGFTIEEQVSCPEALCPLLWILEQARIFFPEVHFFYYYFLFLFIYLFLFPQNLNSMNIHCSQGCHPPLHLSSVLPCQ